MRTFLLDIPANRTVSLQNISSTRYFLADISRQTIAQIFALPLCVLTSWASQPIGCLLSWTTVYSRRMPAITNCVLTDWHQSRLATISFCPILAVLLLLPRQPIGCIDFSHYCSCCSSSLHETETALRIWCYRQLPSCHCSSKRSASTQVRLSTDRSTGVRMDHPATGLHCVYIYQSLVHGLMFVISIMCIASSYHAAESSYILVCMPSSISQR